MKTAIATTLLFSIYSNSVYGSEKNIEIVLQRMEYKYDMCNFDFIITNNFDSAISVIALQASFSGSDGNIIGKKILSFNRTKIGLKSVANYVAFHDYPCTDFTSIVSYEILPGTLVNGEYIWPSDPWYGRIEDAIIACSKVSTFDVSAFNKNGKELPTISLCTN